jgi:DNA-binding transcriptional LysR family regulator
MDFKRLGYFAQVAELGSLSKTASKIGIAQPSLSRQMRILEEELGVSLFTRAARGMMLTEAGDVLYSRIAGPLREIGHAIYEVRSLPTEAGGSVVFGMPPTMIQVLAGSLARRMATFAPRVTLRLVDAYSGHLQDWLERGELDAAILYGPTPAGLNATKLLEDELVLVGAANSPLAAEGSIECRRLQDLPLILSSPAHGLRLLIEAAAAKARIKLNIHTQTDSYQLLKELVESGIGYTILPYCAVTREAAAGRLAFVRIGKPTITRQLFLAMSPSAQAPQAVLQVEKLVREEVGALARQNGGAFFRLTGIGEN